MLAKKVDFVDEKKETLAICEEKKSNHEPFSKQIKKEIRRIRKNLPKLEINEYVLAKWSDDGWYYFGRVKEIASKYAYLVVDCNNYEEIIKRENILTSNQASTLVSAISYFAFK